MKRVVIGVIVVLAAGSLAADQAVKDADSIERAFAPGGAVTLSLASGDYTVRGGADNRIVVRWSAGDEARVRDLRQMSVKVHLAGTTAIVTTDGPTKNVDFTIEIPARSDLYVRVQSGDVQVDGIEGNKDIRMKAGDLTIGVRPEALSHAHASVTFGDLDARALGISRSGIKRSLNWAGGGSYTLDARLFAGDLVLKN